MWMFGFHPELSVFPLQSRLGQLLLLSRDRSGGPALLGPRPPGHQRHAATVETEERPQEQR